MRDRDARPLLHAPRRHAPPRDERQRHRRRGDQGASGELGNGTFTPVPDSSKYYRATQVEIAHADSGAIVYLDQVTALGSPNAVPGYATGQCAIRQDKTLWCWGITTQGNLWQGTIGCVSGNLGTGDTTSQTYPVQVPSGGARIAAGAPRRRPAAAGPRRHDVAHHGLRLACAVDGAGTAWCWGDKTGTPTIAREAIPFVNQNGSTPSGPMQYLTTNGGGGFSSSLNYLTTTASSSSG